MDRRLWNDGVLVGVSMIENILAHHVGNSRPGSVGRRVSHAVMLAWIAILMAPAVNAAEPARDNPAQAANAGGNVAGLNHQPASLAAVPAVYYAPSGAAAEEVGILFLRSD